MTITDSASVIRRREGALPQPPSPQGTLAVLSGNQRKAIAAALGRFGRPKYLQVADFIRAQGSGTSDDVRGHFGWNGDESASAVHLARAYGLIARNGVKIGRCFLYRPVVVSEWPS